MGSVPSEHRRERAVSLDVQIRSECVYSAAVSTSVFTLHLSSSEVESFYLLWALLMSQFPKYE